MEVLPGEEEAEDMVGVGWAGEVERGRAYGVEEREDELRWGTTRDRPGRVGSGVDVRVEGGDPVTMITGVELARQTAGPAVD